MMPLAAPRAAVGNSSGPYTPRAGTAMAPNTDAEQRQHPDRPAADQVHGHGEHHAGAHADGPDQPSAPPVGQLAADDDPEAAGRVGEDLEHGDRPGREAPLGAQVLVQERRGRQHEQREGQSRGRQQERAGPGRCPGRRHPAAAASPRRRRRCARRWAVGGRRASAAVNRRVSGMRRPQPHHDGQGRERHQEQDPPGRRPEAGHRHQHHREPGAEGAGGGQHRHREGPGPGGHLLHRDDADDQHEGGREGPGDGLADAQRRPGWGPGRRWRSPRTRRRRTTAAPAAGPGGRRGRDRPGPAAPRPAPRPASRRPGRR